MIESIYTWIENLAFYMVVMVAAMQMIPGENYKKYVRFFVGLILIMMTIGPLFKIMEIDVEGFFGN